MRRYFDELAGKFGRQYVPGRSWKGIAEALLKLMPPMVIADLGAGEGTISQLMAQRAKKVIAVDNSEKMVEFGVELARKHEIANLEYRLGDLEDVPIRSGTVDLAFLSQALHHAVHPERAIGEAWRILKRGGRIAILDLSRHHFEEAREMYADLWLGFTELEVERFMKAAGFKNVETAVVYREQEAPYFETMLATGEELVWDRPPGLSRCLPLVTDHAEEVAALLYVLGAFDAFRHCAIDYTNDSTTLFAFGDYRLDRVGGRAEDRTDFGHILDSAEHVDGVAIGHHHDENVPRGQGTGIFCRQRLQGIIVAVYTCQAGAGCLVERHAEFHLRDGVYDGLVDVFHRLNEVRLAENQVAALGDFQRNEFIHY